MLSFISAVWLAAAFVVKTEGGSPTCYSNGLYLPCTHTVSCEGSSAHLGCSQGKIIRVHHANYGRQDFSTCSHGRPSHQLANIHCSSAATNTVANMCNGKSNCYVKAINSVFGDPCYGTYKYLQVSYFCEPRKAICEHSSHRLQCAYGKVIRIIGADYGRRDTTTCSAGRPSSQLQNVNCKSSTSSSVVARMCNGRSSCFVEAKNSVFGDPCSGTFKYLQLSFLCV